MAVSTDIMRTWRGPRAVYRDLLAQGRREDRLIAFLMAGCLMLFVAGLPRLQRAAQLDGADFQRDVAYSFFAILMIAPLFFYALALLGTGLARLLGQRVNAYQGRLALFWALLAASPAALLYGLLAGFNGIEHTGTSIVGSIWAAALLAFWILGIVEAAGEGPDGA